MHTHIRNALLDDFCGRKRSFWEHFWRVWAARGAGQVVWHSVLVGSLLGARFFISSGSSGSRTGWLAVGFGRFVAWSAFFHQSGQLVEQGRWASTRLSQVRRVERAFSSVRAARGAGQVGWHSVLAGSLLGARVFHQLGQLGEQGRRAGTRVWQVRCLERVFSSVRAARGAGQVGWQSVLAG